MGDEAGHMSNEIDTGPAARSGTSLQVIPGGKEPDKLTGKQLAFVQAILKGENQSNAYRLAYSSENMSPQAIWTEAGRLFRHPVPVTVSRFDFPFSIIQKMLQKWVLLRMARAASLRIFRV